jgi:hypothetical protein
MERSPNQHSLIGLSTRRHSVTGAISLRRSGSPTTHRGRYPTAYGAPCCIAYICLGLRPHMETLFLSMVGGFVGFGLYGLLTGLWWATRSISATLSELLTRDISITKCAAVSILFDDAYLCASLFVFVFKRCRNCWCAHLECDRYNLDITGQQ